MSSMNRAGYHLSRMFVLVTLLIGQSGLAPVSHATIHPVSFARASTSPSFHPTASVPIPAPAAFPAAASAALSAPTSTCTTDQLAGAPGRIDFGGKDEIIIPKDNNSATSYLTPKPGWSTQWSRISGLANAFTAFSHNGTVQYMLQANGRIYHDWLYPDQSIQNAGVLDLNISEQTSPNGGVAVGRPAAVALDPTTIMAITRVNNNTLWFRTGGDDASGWDKTTWKRIHTSVSAASNPVAVSRDANHVAVFYKDASNKVYVTEMAYGNWPSSPASLGSQSLVSNLTVVSRNPGHLAVFGVSADNHLWMREWTDANKTDWSDTTWQDTTATTPGVSAAKSAPAVVAVGGRVYAQIVDAFGERYWIEQTYDDNGRATGWTRTLTGSDTITDNYTLAPIDSTNDPANDHGSATVLRATLNSKNEVWGYQPGSNGSNWSRLHTNLNPSEPPVLVSWGINQAVLIAKGFDNNLYATTYNPGWQNSDPHSQTAYNIPDSAAGQKKQMVFLKSGGTPYVAWLEKGSYTFPPTDWQPYTYSDQGGIVKLASIDGATVTSPYHPHALYGGQQFLLAADIDGSGDQSLIVVRRESATSLRVELHTAGGMATEWPLKWMGIGDTSGETVSGMLMDAVVGDFDGDGVRNEVVMAVINGRTITLYPAYYDYKGDKQLHYLQNQKAQTSIDGDIQGNLMLTSGRFYASGNDKPQEQVMLNLVYRASTGSYWHNLQAFALTDDTDNGTFSSTRLTHDRWDKSYMLHAEAADFNGDGFDETALLYVSGGRTYIGVYDVRDANKIAFNVMGVAVPLFGLLSFVGGNFLHAGDLDGDGRAELIAFNSGGQLTVFGQDIATQQSAPSLRAKYTLTNQNGLSPGRDFLIGDANNDSLQLVPSYPDCENLTQNRVVAVIYSPPRRNTDQTSQIHYGVSKDAVDTKGSTQSLKVGGSVSVGFKVGDPEITGYEVEGKVTDDFAFSWSKSVEHSTSIETASYLDTNNYTNDSGLIVTSQTPYICYYYRRATDVISSTRDVQTCAVSDDTSFVGYSPEKWALHAQDPGWFDILSQTSALPNIPHSSLITDYYSKLPGNAIPAAHLATRLYPTLQCSGCTIDKDTVSQGFTFAKVVDRTESKTTAWENNTTVSVGGEVGHATFEASATFGVGAEHTNSLTWGSGFDVDVRLDPPTAGSRYSYQPYVYQATAKTQYGASYPYMVLDYY